MDFWDLSHGASHELYGPIVDGAQPTIESSGITLSNLSRYPTVVTRVSIPKSSPDFDLSIYCSRSLYKTPRSLELLIPTLSSWKLANQVCVEFWGDGFCNWWGCLSLLPYFSFPFCISFVRDDLRWDMLVFHFSCCLTVDVEQGFPLLLSYWCLTHAVSVELLVTMFKHGLQNVGFPLLLFQIVVFNPMSYWCWAVIFIWEVWEWRAGH